MLQTPAALFWVSTASFVLTFKMRSKQRVYTGGSKKVGSSSMFNLD